MSLVKIILVMVFSGVGLWTINTYVPMTNTIKAIINAIFVGMLCFWLLATFGIFESIRIILKM
jgi:hypothetical protein